MRVKFKMSREDIDCGERGNCEACPVVMTLQRTLNLRGALVDSDVVQLLWQDGRLETVETPLDVRRFMEKFDAHGSDDVAPILFELELEHAA